MMTMHRGIVFAAILLVGTAAVPARPDTPSGGLPDGFVYVDEVIPDLRVHLRYHGSDNFMGRPVDGYEGGRLILTRPAAEALAGVQEQLRPFNLGLLVYDGYRPQRAVDHFVRWARDLGDQANKAAYYPDVDKRELFAEGYIDDRSGHTRGSTLDLTIADIATGAPLDMGTPWDHFGPESWPSYPDLSARQRANRLLLRALMLQSGFTPYKQEWWHFTLANEPYPDSYFDFPVR
jgi:D-alanyl-D-alanine dipeptidase